MEGRAIHFLLKILDYFLPKKDRLTAESIYPGRLAVFFFLFDLIFCITYFVTPGALSLSNPISACAFSFIVFDSLCLYLIKKSFPFSILMAFFLAILSAFVTLSAFQEQEFQLLSIPMASIPPLITYCLLFSKLKTRIFFLLWAVGLNMLTWAIASTSKTADNPFMDFYGFTYPVLGTIVPIFIYVLFRDLTQRDLELESDWQARSARLIEVTSMTKTMYKLMVRPLNVLDNCLKDLNRNASFDQHSELPQKELEKGLDEIIEISRSFSWIYRAYRDEGSSTAALSQIHQNVQTLISQRIADSGWDLKVPPIEIEAEIQGTIPSMMLLIFSVVVQIIETSELQDARSLRLQVGRRENRVSWLFSWPSEPAVSILSPLVKAGKGPPSIIELRQDLIQDLKVICQAHFREYEESGLRFFQISGDWTFA